MKAWTRKDSVELLSGSVLKCHTAYIGIRYHQELNKLTVKSGSA